jgi:hypothetical protein
MDGRGKSWTDEKKTFSDFTYFGKINGSMTVSILAFSTGSTCKLKAILKLLLSIVNSSIHESIVA